mmetsp:Transcript_8540/g.23102  ORF Transcript_8540/g.23102 Transcript_8540/m.23102 type:complete len:201 (+) Transcript_8540:845-1447(+)
MGGLGELHIAMPIANGPVIVVSAAQVERIVGIRRSICKAIVVITKVARAVRVPAIALPADVAASPATNTTEDCNVLFPEVILSQRRDGILEILREERLGVVRRGGLLLRPLPALGCVELDARWLLNVREDREVQRLRHVARIGTAPGCLRYLLLRPSDTVGRRHPVLPVRRARPRHVLGVVEIQPRVPTRAHQPMDCVLS